MQAHDNITTACMAHVVWGVGKGYKIVMGLG